MSWEDLVARVAGASTHLLGRSRLVALASARDLVHLATGIEEVYGSAFHPAAGSSPEQLELAVRRVAAGQLRKLARWSRDRASVLAPIFLDEDRRSIRALLRGAVAGVPAAERVGPLMPTPALPERALQELARQESPGGIAALLSAWNHPFGRPLLALARDPRADLLRLDLLLNSAYIATSIDRVERTPRADGARRDLVEFVRETADEENASTALQLAGQPASLPPEALFIPQGERLPRETFLSAATAPDSETARTILARAFRGSAFDGAFSGGTPRSFDDAMLGARLRRAIRAAREFPLGAAPVIAFVMRLRSELRDLCLIIWRLAAGGQPIPPHAILSIR